MFLCSYLCAISQRNPGYPVIEVQLFASQFEFFVQLIQKDIIVRYWKVLQDILKRKYKGHLTHETRTKKDHLTWDNSPVKVTNAGWASTVCIYDSNEG